MKFEGDAGKSDGFDCEGERLSMQHCPCCAGEHLGSLEHILHRPHPKSPDPRLLRVANDDREGRWVSSRGVVILVSRLDHARGFMSVGTSGWHVDGVMLQAPKLGAVQRIFQRNVPAGQAFTKVCCPDYAPFVSRQQRLEFHSSNGPFVGATDGRFLSVECRERHAIPGGDTMFLGLNELLESMDEELRALCERLWFVPDARSAIDPIDLPCALMNHRSASARSGVGEDLQQGEGQMSMLPLVYKHPFTGEKTMCFHLGLLPSPSLFNVGVTSK